VIRWREWSSSKVGPLLAAFFYAVLIAAPPPLEVLGSFLAVLTFVCLCASFGYAANDYADWRIDQLAGKANAIALVSPLRARALLLGLLLGGLAALWPFYDRPHVAALALLTYGAGAGYSLHPVRFKERGWLGPLVGAAAQRPLPALVIFAALGALTWEAWLAAALLLLFGLRGMLQHQLRDRENDVQAGIQTYVTGLGQAPVEWQLRRLVQPAEVACLVGLLVSMALREPVLWLLAIGYGAWLAYQLAARRSPARSAKRRGGAPAPLAEFHRVYWPLSLAILLAAREPLLAPLALVVVLWQRQFLSSRLASLAQAVRARSGRTGRGLRPSTARPDN
jgi:4-hydroxybenzoate polyprenyltransferase